MGENFIDDFETPALTDWYFEPGNNGIDNILKNYIGLWNVVFVFFNTLSFKVSIAFAFQGKAFLCASICQLIVEVVALTLHGSRCVRHLILYLKFSSRSLAFLMYSNTSIVRQPYLLRAEPRNRVGVVLQSGH